jgi:hypothetical protein
MELYHSLASGLDGSWFSESGQSAPPALLILTMGELLHRKGAIFFCCGSVPSGFKLRCCTIVNKAFMNGVWGPFHKKIYSLWNRSESLFWRMVQDVSLNLDV